MRECVLPNIQGNIVSWRVIPDMCTTENSDYTPFLACSFIGFFGYVVVYVSFIAHVLWRVNTLRERTKIILPSTVEVCEATLRKRR